MKKVAVRVAVVLSLIVVAAFGVRGYMVWERTRDVLPAFTPVPVGEKAPRFQLVDAVVGETKLPEVKARLEAAGLACRDTSMRGLMKLGRETARQKMAEAEAKGEDPDAVSGASRAYYYSKKEQNPQVQWTCERIPLRSFSDENLREHIGDVTFIFDSEEHPLRYVVVSRKFKKGEDALVAAERSLEKFAVFGPPTKKSGAPVLEPGKPPFPRYSPVKSQWSFADRRAEVVVMNLGPRGVDVRELVEVPWPVEVTPPPK
jgi:hypothetical protein